MLICLHVQRPGADGSLAGPFRYRFERGELLFGRSEAVDVRLPDRAVSLVHARLLEQDDGQLVLSDLGSTNGTLLDGRRLAAGEAAVVGPGACFRVGPFLLELLAPLSVGEQDAPITPQRTADLARQLLAEAFSATSEATPELEVLGGPSRGDRLTLALGASSLGRGVECTFRLPDGDCSRKHAELRRGDAGVEVVDLGSKNGVEVNGERIVERHLLRHRDELLLGRTRLRYHDPAEELLAQLQLGDDLPLVTPIAEADALEANPPNVDTQDATGEASNSASQPDEPSKASDGVSEHASFQPGAEPSVASSTPQGFSAPRATTSSSDRRVLSTSVDGRLPTATGDRWILWIVGGLLVVGAAAAVAYLLLG